MRTRSSRGRDNVFKGKKAVKITVEQNTKPRRRRRSKDVLIEFILDETGSMGRWQDEVTSGYNKYINEQREMRSTGKCYLSLTKFDTNGIKNVCENVRIEDAPLLDRYNYRPGATTNLYDAIGTRLTHILNNLERLDTTSIVIVVFTDGEENASREYSYDEVRRLIARCEAQGMTFVYMGANQDAWKVGYSLGVSNYLNTKTFDMKHTGATFAALNNATATYRSSRLSANALEGQAYSFFETDAEIATDIVPNKVDINVKVTQQ